eukprot:7123954-Prymnesium_polylepis.1
MRPRARLKVSLSARKNSPLFLRAPAHPNALHLQVLQVLTHRLRHRRHRRHLACFGLSGGPGLGVSL